MTTGTLSTAAAAAVLLCAARAAMAEAPTLPAPTVHYVLRHLVDGYYQNLPATDPTYGTYSGTGEGGGRETVQIEGAPYAKVAATAIAGPGQIAVAEDGESYDFELVGPGTTPIDLSFTTLLAVRATPGTNLGYPTQDVATATVDIEYSTLVPNPSRNNTLTADYDQTLSINEYFGSTYELNDGTLNRALETFTIPIVPNTLTSISLGATAIGQVGHSAYAYADPYIQFTGPHAGYSLDFSPGVTNAPAMPEPSTWAMILLGTGGLGGILRARRRQTISNFAAGAA